MKRVPDLAAARWRAFQRKTRRRDPEEYELFPFQAPIELRFGGATPAKLFYCTKPITMSTLDEQGLIPRDWLILNRFLMPTEEAITVIRSLMKDFGLRQLFFVGDLDPLDLTNFAILRAGSPGFARSASAVNVEYAGIDDAWLELSQGFRTRPSPEYDQSPFEREHLEIVLDLLPDLEALVGPRCFALLKAGKQISQEAAYSPGGYKKEFGGHLIKHLDAKAKRLTRQGRKPRRSRSTRG